MASVSGPTGRDTSSTDQAKDQALASFHAHLSKSSRVLALCGAGLSASSGLPTFRGAGGLWRTHESTSLATPGAFASNPGLVWQFYSYRRHMALGASPNAAHYALAELARRMPDFQTLTQNVDGLSQRAAHPPKQLQLLHGSLFKVKCSDEDCGYVREDFTDPIVPALALPASGEDPTTTKALEKGKGKEVDISDAAVAIPSLAVSDLPPCPQCNACILRPGVVWFGEALPFTVLDTVESYLRDRRPIDLIMVIGTSARVFPAAGYIEQARAKGARVAVVNMDENDRPPGGWRKGDWFFQGDAAELLPQMLRPVIGELETGVDKAKG